MLSSIKYIEFFKKNKYLIVVLVVGILLLLLPGKSDGTEKEAKINNLEFSLDEWEKKIKDVLAQCQGVGRVKVALSVSGGTRSVYAVEESLNVSENGDDYTKDKDEKISIISVGSGVDAPVVIREVYPEFIGATVVCDGADISKVRLDVTYAVSALTGLSADKISIIKMRN